jgi:hypothetical protein
MKALVDEKELSDAIVRNGPTLSLLAFLAISFLIFGSDAWLVAAASAGLLAGFTIKGWEPKVLLSYGIAMVALTCISAFIAKDYMDWTGIQGYWLICAGTLGMAYRLLTDAGDQRPALDEMKPASPNAYSKPFIRRRTVA